MHPLLPLVAAAFLLQPQPEPAPAPSSAPPVKAPEPPKLTGPDLAKTTDPKDAKALEKLLLAIAGEYTKYARVSDRANWAPELCMIPPPAGVQSSASTQEKTHGRKLYFLYAADAQAYDKIGWWAREDLREKKDPKTYSNPVGTIVVKEAFKPAEVKDGEKVPDPPKTNDIRQPLMHPNYTTLDGKLYKTGDSAGLFIMVKLDPQKDARRIATDDGWVYATTSPDAKTITSSGVIESCIDCHKDTGRDRLYGPQWSWPRDKDRKLIPPSITKPTKPDEKPTDPEKR